VLHWTRQKRRVGELRRYASLMQTKRVVEVPRTEVEDAATRLQDEGLIEIGAPIDWLPGTWLVW
jgi:hypothetical protein